MPAGGKPGWGRTLALGIFWYGFLETGIFAAPPEPLQENSCVACHAGLNQARLRDPVEQWEASRHAEVGNTCEGCHGGDPARAGTRAMDRKKGFVGKPEAEKIPSFCGKCHQGVLESFRKSSHFSAGEPVCSDCHGAHALRRFSRNIIQENTCAVCHDYDRPRELRELMETLRKENGRAVAVIASFEGFSPVRLKSLRQGLDQEYRGLRREVHTFDMDRIRKKAQEVQNALNEIAGETGRLKQVHSEQRWLGLIFVSAFLVLAAVVARINYLNKKDFENS